MEGADGDAAAVVAGEEDKDGPMRTQKDSDVRDKAWASAKHLELPVLLAKALRQLLLLLLKLLYLPVDLSSCPMNAEEMDG